MKLLLKWFKIGILHTTVSILNYNISGVRSRIYKTFHTTSLTNISHRGDPPQRNLVWKSRHHFNDIRRWGGSKTKEISMKNIGVKVLITNRIIWNSKQTKNKKQAKTQPTLQQEKSQMTKNTKTKTSPSQQLKSPHHCSITQRSRGGGLYRLSKAVITYFNKKIGCS